MSPSAVYRHKTGHLPARLKRAFEAQETRKAVELAEHRTEERAKEVGQAIDIVQQLRAINSATLQVLQAARESEKHSLSLQAVDRVHKQIELQAKLLGELQESGPTVNVLVAPEWRELRVTVLQALTPFPDARAAVAEVLTDARS
ncbi:MAG TPA: hypothetical protein VLF66_20425 [Thermoanaerobaculia bacterium]|nr:hypothetical protein [Thermoanaerobaculia bacterium]